MYSNREDLKAFRYAVCTTLAACLVAGCAGKNPLAKANSRAAVAAMPHYANDKGLAGLEKSVAQAPGDASLRIDLAGAYLQAGRFDSAVTTFEDAIALGAKTPRTALSLALAYVGSGRNPDALALLDEWRDTIPASDYGLAIALAGDTGRGVAILADELRGGRDDVKLRQNLAYAYALDGRWAEARLMAAQDLPADKLDARISEWAMQGRPEDYNKRVASLLGAPLRTDPGQPQHLALSNTGAVAPARIAMAESNNPAPDTDRELPPIEGGESFWNVESRQPAPLLQPIESHAAAPPNPIAATSAFPQSDEQAPVSLSRNDSVSAPVGRQFEDAFAAADPAPQHISQPTQILGRPVAAPRASHGDATHAVQLGSFSSLANAERAWTIYKSRYPGLADQDLRITEAVVRGRKFWRVAAAGYDRSSARTMCSTVKGGGYGCIAYVESRPLPGALQHTAGSGPMRARR